MLAQWKSGATDFYHLGIFNRLSLTLIQCKDASVPLKYGWKPCKDCHVCTVLTDWNATLRARGRRYMQRRPWTPVEARCCIVVYHEDESVLTISLLLPVANKRGSGSPQQQRRPWTALHVLAATRSQCCVSISEHCTYFLAWKNWRCLFCTYKKEILSCPVRASISRHYTAYLRLVYYLNFHFLQGQVFDMEDVRCELPEELAASCFYLSCTTCKWSSLRLWNAWKSRFWRLREHENIENHCGILVVP